MTDAAGRTAAPADVGTPYLRGLLTGCTGTLDECGVCLTVCLHADNQDKKRILPCGHALCTSCAARIASGLKEFRRCPFCMQKFVSHRDVKPALVTSTAGPVVDTLLVHPTPVQTPPKRVRFTDGFTPLHKAAEKGHEAVMMKLLEAGAAVDAVTAQGFTPLHVAAQEGYEAVMEASSPFGSPVTRVKAKARTTPAKTKLAFECTLSGDARTYGAYWGTPVAGRRRS
jgi:ankyrin repeat protein